MKPPGKARTDRNKYAAHKTHYKTFYISGPALVQLDKLKKQWFLSGRGKVVEKLLRMHAKGQLQENTREDDIDRYV